MNTMKRVRSILQEECAAAPDDDRVAFVRDRSDDPLRQPEDSVGVQQVQPRTFRLPSKLPRRNDLNRR